MKIALLGYGKMGKTIEQLAVATGHTIVFTKSATTQTGTLNKADVAIEFSSPEVAKQNILQAFSANIPVVCGTTGWLSQLSTVEKACLNCNTSFIYASNFSIGVNLFFNLNNHLAKLMAPWKDFNVSMTEIHHTEKKDAPSGTAITLAEDIIKNNESLIHWNLNEEAHNAIKILALREKDVKGTHSISYTSSIDTITIKHEAHSREGFAKGALLAAQYIKDKKGIYTMKQVLGL